MAPGTPLSATETLELQYETGCCGTTTTSLAAARTPNTDDKGKTTMSDESDYRDMLREKTDREQHLADLRATSARREELIALRTTEIKSSRRYVAEQEAKLADDQRQLKLDAETIRIVEAYHANRIRTNEALSGDPFHRAAYDALNTLRLEHMRLNAEAGVRVSDAQKGRTWDELYEAWAVYVTHNAIANDIARLMSLMGRPVDLVDVDTVYPDDAPQVAGGRRDETGASS